MLETSSTVITPLDESVYNYFDSEISWEMHLEIVKQLGINAVEYAIGIEKQYSNPDIAAIFERIELPPANILHVRTEIMKSVIQHAHEFLNVHNPIYSGRSGNSVIYDGTAPRVGTDDLVWAVNDTLFTGVVGEVMNNPFAYMYKKYNAYSGNGPFVPMISVFDSDKMVQSNGYTTDTTAWKPATGYSLHDCIAGLYYFNPKQLTF
jgi:hypothetical protein